MSHCQAFAITTIRFVTAVVEENKTIDTSDSRK